MASQQRDEDKLDDIAATIVRLRGDLVAHVRAAGMLLDGEEAAEAANDKVAATRLLLDAMLGRYFDLAEEMRSKRCKVHGTSIIAACDACRRLHGLDRTRAA